MRVKKGELARAILVNVVGWRLKHTKAIIYHIDLCYFLSFYTENCGLETDFKLLEPPFDVVAFSMNL